MFLIAQIAMWVAAGQKLDPCDRILEGHLACAGQAGYNGRRRRQPLLFSAHVRDSEKGGILESGEAVHNKAKG